MQLHPNDNVEVLLQPEGEIPAGHKVALRDIKKGENVIKYGFPIGHATTDIAKGDWVHTHNIATNLEGTLEYRWKGDVASVEATSKQQANVPARPTFMGYLREDGRVGVRNELWILPTVGCVADLASRLANKMSRQTALTVRAFPHTFGCSQLGDDHANTRQLLASLAMHPNAGGVLVLGLGCENNQINELKPLITSSRVEYLITQEVEDEVEEGLNILKKLAEVAAKAERTEQPVSKLCIGLKCGGSDGFSGITANPLLGRFSDLITSLGATSILTEVPEMFGAETILMDRCISEDIFNKTVRLVNDFKEYYLKQGLPVGENPSPGNKEGGITTLEDKSLGCIQKGGTSNVFDVIDYGHRAQTSGLNLLCAPGNDLVASTALAVAGCQMVLFTTGRGTPFGTCVPTVKVSTNSNLAKRKPHWVDFNAGVLVEGKTFEEVVPQFCDTVISIANGELTNNEKQGYSSIAIWKGGVTL